MRTQPTDSFTEFTTLRSFIRASARKTLENENPSYVEKSLGELETTGNSEAAQTAALPLMGDGLPGAWKDLLRLTVDYEFALDQCRLSLSLLGKPPPAEHGWNSGMWVVYHKGYWTFQFYAWLERLGALVKKVCRVLLRERSADWKQVEGKLSARVQTMKKLVEPIRNPLAHTGEGGVVEGVTQEKLWETQLLIGFDEDAAPDYYKQVGPFQDWHNKIFSVTAIGVLEGEAILRSLNKRLENL